MKPAKYIVAAFKNRNGEFNIYASEIDRDILKYGIEEFITSVNKDSSVLEFDTSLTKYGARRIHKRMEKKYNPPPKSIEYGVSIQPFG